MGLTLRVTPEVLGEQDAPLEISGCGVVFSWNSNVSSTMKRVVTTRLFWTFFTFRCLFFVKIEQEGEK